MLESIFWNFEMKAFRICLPTNHHKVYVQYPSKYAHVKEHT